MKEVRVQNMNHLKKKVAAYERALQKIIDLSSYTREHDGGPDFEAVKDIYKIAVTAASAFAPLVEEGVLYLVKRYEGADPAYLIAYPIINREGNLEGWQELPDKFKFPLFPDDEVFIFNTKELTQVVTWRGGPSDTGVDG